MGSAGMIGEPVIHLADENAAHVQLTIVFDGPR
jgi:hypothetical protein